MLEPSSQTTPLDQNTPTDSVNNNDVDSPQNRGSKGLVMDTERFLGWYQTFPIKMISSPTKGRCLATKKPLKAGETVLSTHPLLWAPDESTKEHICRYCLRQTESTEHTQPIQCKRCKDVYYCSDKCRATDSVFHNGFECKMIANWELNENYEKELITEMKLLIRAVSRKRYDEKQKQKPEPKKSDLHNKGKSSNVPTSKQKASKKNSHKSTQTANKPQKPFSRSENNITIDDYLCLIAQPDDFSAETILSVREWICSYLSKMSEWLGCMESEDSLLELLVRNRRNSFSIWDDDSNGQRGIGVYVRPSFINHSCEPNLEIRRDKSSRLGFYVKENLPTDEELTISYVNLDEDLSQRRKTLLENYLFHCNCSRCMREENEPKDEQKNEPEEETDP